MTQPPPRGRGRDRRRGRRGRGPPTGERQTARSAARGEWGLRSAQVHNTTSDRERWLDGRVAMPQGSCAGGVRGKHGAYKNPSAVLLAPIHQPEPQDGAIDGGNVFLPLLGRHDLDATVRLRQGKITSKLVIRKANYGGRRLAAVQAAAELQVALRWQRCVELSFGVEHTPLPYPTGPPPAKRTGCRASRLLRVLATATRGTAERKLPSLESIASCQLALPSNPLLFPFSRRCFFQKQT